MSSIIFAVIFLGLASLIGSGILFRHQRMLTLLAASGALFEGSWLALTLVHRALALSLQLTFLSGAMVLLIVSVIFWRRWRWPYNTVGSGWRDVAVLIVLIPVIASAWFIQAANGLRDDGSWVAHGFYNGDTTTFISLVQRSLITDGLVRTNPFAGNGPLEYPTLVHAGLADIISVFGGSLDWLYFIPLIVFIQICITVPLFFLLRDVVKDAAGYRSGYRWGWRGLVLEGGVIVYIMALSWESYVYLQGHFFTTGLFIFLTALLVRSWSLLGRLQLAWAGLAAVMTVLLVLSNAVTGTAAAVVWSIFALLRWFETTRSYNERLLYIASIVALAFMYISFTPGQGSLSVTPWFSYSAVPNMMMLAAPLLLLLIAQLQQLRQQAFSAVATVALAALAFVTFVFSDRDIVIENSSRFLYHALLVGWPLAIDSIVRNVRIVQAHLRRLEWVPLQVSGVAGAGVAFVLLVWPALASVASVHDHLLFQNEHTTHAGIRAAMQWIYAHTAPDAVFLASPAEPWAVPLFTGRALVRADYWLSPGDALEETVKAAFAGDAAAQSEALTAADYVLLKMDEREQWDIEETRRIYHFGDVSIFDVRQ